jgi:hypothetical protein
MRGCAGWALLVFVVAASVGTSAQAPPASPALSAYLARYYFKTPADEVAVRAELNTALVELGRFKGQVNSAPQLLGVMRQSDAVQTLFARHEHYITCVAPKIARMLHAMPITPSNPTLTPRPHSSVPKFWPSLKIA